MQKQTLNALGIIFLLIAAINTATGDVTLVRFGPEGEEKPGIIDSEGQLRDLSGYVSEITPETLSSASLDAIAQLSLDDLPAVAGEPRLGVPLTGIGKIIAIGFNYINHAAEMEVQLPAEPLTFMKATSALTGPFDQIIQPRNGLKLDYEAELVVVIGSRAQYISEEDVFDHIAGYTVGHDVSERAFQRERGGQFTKGKSADTFAPVGPYFVSADQIKDIQALSIWSEVNGEMRQRGAPQTWSLASEKLSVI